MRTPQGLAGRPSVSPTLLGARLDFWAPRDPREGQSFLKALMSPSLPCESQARPLEPPLELPLELVCL